VQGLQARGILQQGMPKDRLAEPQVRQNFLLLPFGEILLNPSLLFFLSGQCANFSVNNLHTKLK
jgi:hypothetical protein